MKKLEYPYQPIPMSSIKENDAIVVLSGGLHQAGNKKYSTYEFNDPDRFFAGIDLIKNYKNADHNLTSEFGKGDSDQIFLNLLNKGEVWNIDCQKQFQEIKYE